MNELKRTETEEWLKAGRQALVSGSLASVLSTAVLALLGKVELGKAAAPTNATSHWLWGDRAYDEYDTTLKHTAVGYATHHASAVMWATIFERWLNYTGTLRSEEIVRGAVGMTALASFVDYQLTPHRLRPGFETHLSRGELVGVFAAFGAGLALGAILNRQHERRLEQALTLPEGTDEDQYQDRRQGQLVH
jgi:hypothetical protein